MSVAYHQRRLLSKKLSPKVTTGEPCGDLAFKPAAYLPPDVPMPKAVLKVS